MLNEQRAELCTPEFTTRWGQTRSFDLLERRWAESDATASVEKLVHADIGMYLPDDLLVKMDIASMAHSLEVRSPFLDHHVVEFAAGLPLSLKLRGRTTKYLLKKVMRRYLPAEVINRRKMGFGVPIDHWLRDGLHGLAHDLLLSQTATARGYFRPEMVRRYLDDHAAQRAQHHTCIWAMLMLEQWHRTFIDRRLDLAETGDAEVAPPALSHS